jgi:FtsH-binding integral membrane protein
MELKISFVISVIGSILFNTFITYIYNKLKNHSSKKFGNKSGFELELIFKFKFKK